MSDQIDPGLESGDNPQQVQEFASFGDIFRVFWGLGWTSFGGPVAHLAYFRQRLVEREGWLSEAQYAQLVAICQFLPGPASSQVGFAMGLFRGGWAGAGAAFLGFTLPSVLLLIAFALSLPLLPVSLTEHLIHGLKLLACIVVADAVWGMYQKLCNDRLTRSIAVIGASFILLTGSLMSQLVLVAASALLGWLACQPSFKADDTQLPVFYKASTGRKALGAFGILFGILFVLGGIFDWAQLVSGFYQAGALVFGGGHVVLPWLEASVVGTGHLSPEEFVAGYGAAQAVPGPMFTFSAYLGAMMSDGWGLPVFVGICVAAVFMPGFLLLIGFLPFWHRLSALPKASQALVGVNAGVVGILAAVLYDPVFTSAVGTPTDAAIVLLGMLCLKVFKLPIIGLVGTVLLMTCVFI